MLEGTSIICFAKDWGGDPTSSNHIMRVLSDGNQVLWVNSIGIRRPGFSGRDLKRLTLKFTRALKGTVRAGRNIHVFNPLVIPLPDAAPIARLNNLLLSTTLRGACRRLGMTRPIIWSFLPNITGLVGKLQESAVIYHCVDDYAEFSGVNGDFLRRAERQLVTLSDLVFTSSKQLWKERVAYNPNSYFVPHGVDVNHFSRARDPHLTIPEDIAGVRHPIVGFFGLLADWVDLDVVGGAARIRPDWSFVLVGRCATDVSMLKGLPNVHLLGQRPYETLPAYCRAFDVGVIPFRMNNLTVKANPLKLREYLAAGLPVVSTPLPEVAKYAELVRMAGDADEFVHEIEQALKERGEGFAQARVAAMRRESWESRVEEFSRYISERLGRRGIR